MISATISPQLETIRRLHPHLEALIVATERRCDCGRLLKTHPRCRGCDCLCCESHSQLTGTGFCTSCVRDLLGKAERRRSRRRNN